MSLVHAPVRLGQATWDFSRTYVFGVVNVTPDSFSDGGRFFSTDAAVAHGWDLIEQGADALDIGGESTRPGAEPVPAEEESRRVLPVVRQLAGRGSVPISIDTYKAGVARAAVEAGASMINDISGLQLDPQMATVAAEAGVPLIIGHLRGTPKTMRDNIRFVDVVAEVAEELKRSVRTAVAAGVSAERIWVDPCIGFGKTAAQSLALLRSTGRLREAVGYPLMVGPSRKSFIGAVTGEGVEARQLGTCAAIAAVVVAGADAVRLHDVGLLLPAVRVADAIRRQDPAEPVAR